MFTTHDVLQIGIYILTLSLLTPLLGGFMAKVFTGEKHLLMPLLRKPEQWIYRICGIQENIEMNWKQYTLAALFFNAFGFALLFLFQIFQASLPLNPQHLPNVSWHLAFNTAVSFMTNTNWQSYAGETTLSYFVQMLGLTVQNFVSAATGIAVALALIRGLARKTTIVIGNFWVDLVRCTLYILLPLSLILSIVLISEGTIQTFSTYHTVTTLEGQTQTIPVGPVASQVAIKQLGSNGGGYFNTNSAHPFENPTPLTNFFEMLSIFLIASGLVYTYGKMVGSLRQGLVLWGVMMALFVVMLGISLTSEYQFHPSQIQGASMEGKETRFGVTNSILWSVATTAASNGSVNAMHDSLTPLSGLIAFLNMMFGEIIFGGVGAGLYGILHFVILTVFIAGLLVGRSPEYLGKKIEAFEVKMSAISVLAPSSVILIFSAIAVVLDTGLSSLSNGGPHGLSQILYAFTSAAANNGSAFAGLNANTIFYNVMLGIGMLIGRFGIIIPTLAIAGSMAKKKITPPSSGTFSTDSVLFAVLLIGVIVIVGALTFFPVLSLGPIVEYMLMVAGKTF